jgi:hypothetical protein
VSIEASSFVLGVAMGRGNGIRKLILLGFANHADKHGPAPTPPRARSPTMPSATFVPCSGMLAG